MQGFFHQPVGQTARGKVKPDRTKVLAKYGCLACPLNKAAITSPKMVASIPSDVDILFLGEAPSQSDDDKSRLFTGVPGNLLRGLIPSSISAGFDNIINCYAGRAPTDKETACCRSRRVKVIQDTKPKLIVGLGVTALQWALGSSDIGGLRGRFFAIKVGDHPCWFLPTYDPEYVLKMGHNRQRPLNSKFGHCFRLDIERACGRSGSGRTNGISRPIIETESEIRSNVQIFNGKEGDATDGQYRPISTIPESRPHPVIGNVTGGATRDLNQLLELLDLAKQAKIKSIDIETSALRPYAKNSVILTVAISFDNTNFAFPLFHPKFGYAYQVMDKLRGILTDDTIKVAHNAIFECEWFAALFGPEVIRHEVWECTQLQAHFLDERRGAGWGDDDETRRNAYQSLDFLSKMYFGTAFKGMFKLDKKNMAKADLTETLIYNAVDTKITLKLYHHQTQLLKEAGLYEPYIMAVPRQAVVGLMQHFGMDVDQVEVKKLQASLDNEILTIRNEINKLDVIKKYVSDHGVFNPLGEDALIVFRDYLKRKEIQVQDGKRLRLSTDKHVLEKINHPLAKLIVTLRNKTKMKSTYVDGFEFGVGKDIWPDGKIHTNFNTTFTVTSRLSSDQPNLQNVPHRTDSYLRKQIIAPSGHYIVAADYGQLEACTAAMCSRDPVLVKALWEDTDVHMQWASRLADLCPSLVNGNFSDLSVAKGFRSLVKNKLVFPAIFGATNNSISGYLGCDIGIIDDLMDEFWGVFAGLKHWQDRVMKGYYDTGYVESPIGRRRHYPMTRNEAINASIQGLASDIVCDSMCRLSFEASRAGNWYLHPRLNIHDDLTSVVPDDKVEEVIETVYRTMLTPQFECVNVPLSVEVSVGRDWYNMETIQKFWSHKDL